MALAPLAVAADLDARGVDVTDSTLADLMLEVASATVRNAAGRVPISETTSTVSLIGRGEQYLPLPGAPISAVSAASIDGTAVTDFVLDGNRLWRANGWGFDWEPTPVSVTLTHGYASVPVWIVDLVCSLAAAGMAASQASTYATADGRIVSEMVGDYQVTYAQGAESVATVMELPRVTRLRLRAQFGGSGVVGNS